MSNLIPRDGEGRWADSFTQVSKQQHFNQRQIAAILWLVKQYHGSLIKNLLNQLSHNNVLPRVKHSWSKHCLKKSSLNATVALVTLPHLRNFSIWEKTPEEHRALGFILAEVSYFQPYTSYISFQWNNIGSLKSITAEITYKHLCTVCTLAQKMDASHDYMWDLDNSSKDLQSCRSLTGYIVPPTVNKVSYADLQNPWSIWGTMEWNYDDTAIH